MIKVQKTSFEIKFKSILDCCFSLSKMSGRKITKLPGTLIYLFEDNLPILTRRVSTL